MMKAYFVLPDVFDSMWTDSFWSRFLLQSVKVDGSEVLTSDYFSERDNSFHQSGFFYPSECGGDPMTICNLGGTINSWNFLADSINATYTSLDGEPRLDFVQSNSGNPYGIEGMGFGFDKIDTPIADNPDGTSSGTTKKGAFHIEFDETKSFSFLLTYTKQQTEFGGGIVDYFDYVAKWNPVSCEFTFTRTSVSPSLPVEDILEYGWLSGDLSGILTTDCTAGGELGNNPIVTQSFCLVAGTPTPPSIIPDQLGCCYQSPVLADLTDSNDGKNDVNGFIVKRDFTSETITLTLEKDGGTALGGSEWTLNSNDYGTFYDWGSLNENQKGYFLEWRKVLQLHGEGVYRIRVNSTLITGTIETFSIPFKLKSYTPERANGTFRMQSIQNGYLKQYDLDLTGLNWKDGIRIEGFFGNRVPEFEDERVIYTNNESRQVRSEKVDKYICQTMHVPSCITGRVIDYHLFGNYMLLSDYNFNNHVKDYLNKRMILDTFDTIEYNSRTDKAKLEVKMKDFDQVSRKTNC